MRLPSDGTADPPATWDVSPGHWTTRGWSSEVPDGEDRSLEPSDARLISLLQTWPGLATSSHWSNWFYLKGTVKTHTGLGAWGDRNEPGPLHRGHTINKERRMELSPVHL